MAEEWELEDITTESVFSESEEGENAHLAHKVGHKVTRADVQHDRALIKWTSGHANGTPIISYQIFAARIREFHYQDIQLQAAISRDPSSVNDITTTTMVGGGNSTPGNATVNATFNPPPPSSSSSSSMDRPPPRVGSQSLLSAVIEEDKELASASELPSLATGTSVSVYLPGGGASTTPTTPSSSETHQTHQHSRQHVASSGSTHAVTTTTTVTLQETGIKESQLEWRDVTTMGEPMGPQAFRALGLSPGTSYVFCVRQRNAIGWSAFSRPRYYCYRQTNTVPLNNL